MKKICVCLMCLILMCGFNIKAKDADENIIKNFEVGSLADIEEGVKAKYRIFVDDVLLQSNEDDKKDFSKTFDSVLYAFAEVVRKEINKLRAEHSLSQYSTAQMITAVKNEMDS